jgi:hypothetical protein
VQENPRGPQEAEVLVFTDFRVGPPPEGHDPSQSDWPHVEGGGEQVVAGRVVFGAQHELGDVPVGEPDHAGVGPAAQLAQRVDLPLAVSVVVVLQRVNIVAAPLWAGRVVTGASASAWDIVKSLLVLVLVLVSLVAGLLASMTVEEPSSSELRRDVLPLRGRNALVTGVSRRAGIGYAITRRLAAPAAP